MVRNITALLVLITVVPPLAQPQAFDAATIKVNRTNDGLSEFQMRPGGRLVVSGMSLSDLVRRAYGSDAIQTPQQIVGGPDWSGSARFDILAVTSTDLDSDPSSRPLHMTAMLRTLLEDRFKLKIHAEDRVADGFALVLADKDGRTGPELRRSTIECPVIVPGVPRPPEAVRCDFRGPRNGQLTAQGVTMKQLAALLASFTIVGRPVRDRTGLDGRFDFPLPFDLSFVRGMPPGQPADPNASVPNLFTALQEQLGLKLQSEKASTPFLVIEHAERPSED